jgi:hypothetical protein
MILETTKLFLTSTHFMMAPTSITPAPIYSTATIGLLLEYKDQKV